jgi:hypothetical protein
MASTLPLVSANPGNEFAEFAGAGARRPAVSGLLGELIEASRARIRPAIARLLPRALASGARPCWGLALVEVDAHFYEPSRGHGALALIAGAWDGRHLIDLVATSARTRAMRRRTGEAALLNDRAVDLARDAHRPLRLHEDGYAWLAARCHGAVVLDWPRAVPRLAEAPGLVCDSEALARRVLRAFERPLPLPPLFAPLSPVPLFPARHSQEVSLAQ